MRIVFGSVIRFIGFFFCRVFGLFGGFFLFFLLFVTVRNGNNNYLRIIIGSVIRLGFFLFGLFCGFLNRLFSLFGRLLVVFLFLFVIISDYGNNYNLGSRCRLLLLCFGFLRSRIGSFVFIS